MIHCFEKHKGNYGRIRIRKELLNSGIDISEYKIARIMKKHGLEAKSGRTGRPKKPKLTEKQYIEENLIRDKFAVTTPNYRWCSDITELQCHHQRMYVCGVIDVATRRLVGWDIAEAPTAGDCAKCFQNGGRQESEQTGRSCIPQRQGLPIHGKENEAACREKRL